MISIDPVPIRAEIIDNNRKLTPEWQRWFLRRLSKGVTSLDNSKIDKVTNAIEDNLAAFALGGNLKDSGYKVTTLIALSVALG